jgi:hypothetical protein
MLIIEVFSTPSYLAHPELNRAQGLGLLTEPSTSSRVNFVIVDKFICQEFDDHSLLVFHGALVQISFSIMSPKKSRINPIREGVCRNTHIKTRPRTERFSPALMVQARERLRRETHALIHQTISRRLSRTRLLSLDSFSLLTSIQDL